MINLYCGDCLDLMKDIPDKSVDMILCDLPYGTTGCSWDIIIPFEELWKHYNRIIKDNCAIVLFGSEPFSSFLRCSNINYYKYDWYWNKKSAGNILTAKYCPLKVVETISVFSIGSCRYFPIYLRGCKNRSDEICGTQKSSLYGVIKSGRFKHSKTNKPVDAQYPKSIIDISKQSSECANGKGLHPTQKPVELLKYLIKTYTQENELVLDNCMGSGSTGVACKELNRQFIGIEKDTKYFEIAQNRINNTLIKNKLINL